MPTDKDMRGLDLAEGDTMASDIIDLDTRRRVRLPTVYEAAERLLIAEIFEPDDPRFRRAFSAVMAAFRRRGADLREDVGFMLTLASELAAQHCRVEALELMIACRDAGICPAALKEAIRLVYRDDWEAAGQEIGQAALEVIPLSSRCGAID